MSLPDPEVKPTLSVPEAAALLNVTSTAAYAAIRSGTWPTRVIRVGALSRIPTADMLRVLGAVEELDLAEWRVTMGGQLVRTEESGLARIQAVHMASGNTPRVESGPFVDPPKD